MSKIKELGPRLENILNQEVLDLENIAKTGEFGSAESERLGRAVRMLGVLAEQARKDADRQQKEGSGMASEEALEALCASRSFRELCLRVLARTLDGTENS